MILIFLLFTIFAIFFKYRNASSLQEGIPFYIVTTISWISLLLYFYFNTELSTVLIFEVSTLLIVSFYGKNLSSFLQFKFISFLSLAMMHVLGGELREDILYIYVLISGFNTLSTKFKGDSHIKYPYLMLSVFSLMKAREFIEPAFSLYIYSFLLVVLALYILMNKFRRFNTDSVLVVLTIWMGIFTFSLDIYFLFLSIVLILFIHLVDSFKFSKKLLISNTLLYVSFLVIIIPYSRFSFLIAAAVTSILAISLSVNRNLLERESCNG